MDRILAKHMRKRETTWYNVEDLRDLLDNIFLRFNVKSLLHFKAVCNRWRSVIRSPSFTKKQLSLSKQEPTFILYTYMDEVTNVYMVNADGKMTEKVTLPGCRNLSFLSMICSYDGLVCFINNPLVLDSEMNNVVLTDLEIRICNPATREVHLLPSGSSSEKEPVVGVAFGQSEYKVFRIFYPQSESEDLCPECEVYSPSIGAWRGIGSILGFPMHSHNVFVGGKVYWFLPSEEDRRTAGSILSVDMEENFRVIELPEEVTEHAFLVNLDEHLCLIAIYDDDLIMDIWLLKYNSEDYYWDRKCSDYIPYSTIEDTDAAAGRKNEIFIITTEHYYLYDIGSRTWKELDFADAIDRNCPAIFSYTESLLPCNGIMVLRFDSCS